MKYINRIFFSVGGMAILLFIFLIALIVGTWLENDFSTQTAKLYIYNSKWLEVVMILLGINLMVNIFRYKMYRKEKFPAFAFHLAFIIILVGSGVTRYFGYEGIMPINEGESRGYMHSSEAYLQLKAHDNKNLYKFEKPLLVSTLSNNYYKKTFKLSEKEEVVFEIIEYLPKAVDSIIEDDSFNTIVELIVPKPEGGMQSVYLQKGKVYSENGLKISLDLDSIPDAIKLFSDGNKLYINSPYTISFMRMSDQSKGEIIKDTIQELNQRQLNQVNGKSFVFKRIYESATLKKVALGTKSEKGVDAIKVKLTQGKKSKEIYLNGGEKRIPDKEFFKFNGLNYELAYGSKIIKLPFLVGLKKFKLERYPGSNSPSSFSSDVIVQDSTLKKDFMFKIFMNNVLDYRGFRFFQSSYMPNEKGTILSVNHDWWGTKITYLGYLLMSIGMILSIFMKGSRIREIFSQTIKIRKNQKISIIVISFCIASIGYGQKNKVVDKNHAERFGKLISQSQEGRLMPMHTVALNILRKIHRKDFYINSQGVKMNPIQVYLEMQLNPKPWLNEKIINVSNLDFRKEFKIPNKYARIYDFFDSSDGQSHYKLEKSVKKANQKSDKEKGKRDKEVIKINDRFQVLNMALTGYFSQIYPIESDTSDLWFTPYEAKFRYKNKDSIYPILQYLKYLSHLKKAKKHGNYDTCNIILDEMFHIQERIAGAIKPNNKKVELEIFYNKLNIFKRNFQFYMVLGTVLLILLFINIFLPINLIVEKIIKQTSIVFTSLIFVVFLFHGIGLSIRWYISGHAPWSNGYEALVFISFILVMAGIIFSKWSKIVLACATFLAALMLFVADMNTMNPEITNLVPVLKSYWLMIHVAIITSSYAFFGLGCMLGLVNLMIEIFRNKNSSLKIKNTYKILTNINEITVTIGLFTLTIGTFLGGVWANESWGRYWGWDAKETWAFISILVYSIILHFRYIPGLKGKSTYNFASSIGYLSIIFTFFGVNYLLSGLHSYAKGDPVPIPNWIYVVVLIVIAVGVWAMKKERNRKKLKIKENE